MDNLTPLINENNISNVRRQIELKKNYRPFMSTFGDIQGTVTDYDVFPYDRYYRGIPGYSDPVVAERETGFRRREQGCYNLNVPKCATESLYPHHCYESACSTVFPCFSRDSNLSIKQGCIPFTP